LKLNVISLILNAIIILSILAFNSFTNLSESSGETVPFYVAWIIHIHQPLYNENGTLTELLNSPSAPSWLPSVWTTRVNIYTKWIPEVALNMIGDEAIHVSITGTLIEQLEELERTQWYNCLYCNWKVKWIEVCAQKTSLGLSRLRILYTGYYHPIFPLIYRSGFTIDFIEQIKKHNKTTTRLFNDVKGKGFFPIETSFSPEIIPVLTELGIEWTVVDSEQVLRATRGYSSSFDPRPNPVDVRNTDPGDWDWGVSPQLVFRPHVVEYNGKEIVVFVRYRHMSQAEMSGTSIDYLINQIKHFQQYNTDPRRPFIMVIVHDGENGWPGHNDGRDYYSGYILEFLRRIRSEPSLSFIKVIGLDEYLAKVYDPRKDREYPYARIWVEPGSWETMSTWGDPDFTMWNSKNVNSPDQKRWSKWIEAVNFYQTALAIVGDKPEFRDELNQSLTFLLKGETSCYWYWDGSEWWDRKAVILFDRSMDISRSVINSLSSVDATPPTIRYAWREPYNPVDSVTIYYQVYDYSGLESVKAYVYVDNNLASVLEAQSIGINNFYIVSFNTKTPGVYRVVIEAMDRAGNRAVYDLTPVFQPIERVVEQPGPFTMDGLPDINTPVYVNENNSYVKTLYAIYTGDNVLYVATEPAKPGYDVFVFISLNPGSVVKPAPWLKNGSVWGYTLYLGNEGENGWCGWFKYTEKYDELVTGGIVACKTGSVLEGYVKLDAALNTQLPDTIYVTVAVYNTSDRGGLIEVLTNSNKLDQTIRPEEYIVLRRNTSMQPPVTTTTTPTLTTQPIPIEITNEIETITETHIVNETTSTTTSGSEYLPPGIGIESTEQESGGRETTVETLNPVLVLTVLTAIAAIAVFIASRTLRRFKRTS